MDRAELLEKLRQLQTARLEERGTRNDGKEVIIWEGGRYDPEVQHSQADDLLIEFINDPEIKEAYEAIPKWYA